MVNEEAKLQARCFLWHWNEYPEDRRMLFHIDNNSYNRIIGAQKKALGVVRGPSDLCYVIDAGHVVWLECKFGDGVQSEEQKEWERKVTQRGHIYILFRTFEEFQKIIRRIKNV